MSKAVLLFGVPGTGKTTIMKVVVHDAGVQNFKIEKFNKLIDVMRGPRFDIVGLYDSGSSEVFQGTDRLSMAASPAFQEYIKEQSPNILMEGDRLCSNSTIDFLLEHKYEVRLFFIKTSQDKIDERFLKRGSNQSEKFLRGRKTKIENVFKRLELRDKTSILSNEFPSDLKNISAAILREFP